MEEYREILEKTMGKQLSEALLGPKMPANFDQIILAVATDHQTNKTLLANLKFEEEKNEFYDEFLVQVILKRMRVFFPEMQITIPAVLLVMLLSGNLGQIVENLHSLDRKSTRLNSSHH